MNMDPSPARDQEVSIMKLMNCRLWLSLIVLILPASLVMQAGFAEEHRGTLETEEYGPVAPGDSLEDLSLIRPVSIEDGADPLMEDVNMAIDVAARRMLSVEVHTPWQIVHGILALRHDYLVKQNGEPTSALGWVATGPSFQGRPWFLTTRYGGKGHPFTEPYAFEGHPNQFIALFTASNLPLDYEFKAGERTITVADILRNAQMEVNSREEITWTLWALCHYMSVDTQWTNMRGEQWSMERLVQIQSRKNPTDAACGGNHGLFTAAKARNVYLETGKPLRGVWMEADMYVKRYVATAKSMQNPDGSFSSNYYRGPGRTNDIDKRVSTTGHTLEFLMMALPREELSKDWIRNAVQRIATDMIENRKTPMEPGGMYHAVDSLVMYRERMHPDYAIPGYENTTYPACHQPNMEEGTPDKLAADRADTVTR